MRLFVDIVGFAAIAFLVIEFVLGLTLSRTDRAGEGPDEWSGGGGHGFGDGSGHGT